MSERILSCQFLEDYQVASAEHIGEKALADIDQTYGSGYPLWIPGENELPYHNGHHGRAVGEGAVKLCVALGLSKTEQKIGELSGKAHDYFQGPGHEAKSAFWLNRQMKDHGFTSYQRELGRFGIYATKPVFKNGRLAGQKATELSYPSLAAELVGKSVASADLGELYTPHGSYLAHQLFREIHGAPIETAGQLDKLIDFQRKQLTLLETYTYPLPLANRLLTTHKSEVIGHTADLLLGLEAGTINSWEQLIAADLTFIARH